MAKKRKLLDASSHLPADKTLDGATLKKQQNEAEDPPDLTLSHLTNIDHQRLTLLGMPPEIRNMIYRLVCVEDCIEIQLREHAKPPYAIRVGQAPYQPCTEDAVRGQAMTYTDSKSGWTSLKASIAGFALIQASKKIHEEAATVAYGLNIFRFRDNTALDYFFQNIGQRYQQSIRHVDLSGLGKTIAPIVIFNSVEGLPSRPLASEVEPIRTVTQTLSNIKLVTILIRSVPNRAHNERKVRSRVALDLKEITDLIRVQLRIDGDKERLSRLFKINPSSMPRCHACLRAPDMNDTSHHWCTCRYPEGWAWHHPLYEALMKEGFQHVIDTTKDRLVMTRGMRRRWDARTTTF